MEQPCKIAVGIESVSIVLWNSHAKPWLYCISEYAVMEQPCRILMNIESMSMLSWNGHAEYWWTLNQWICCHGTAMQNINEHWISEYTSMEQPCRISYTLYINSMNTCIISWHNRAEYLSTLNWWERRRSAMQNLHKNELASILSCNTHEVSCEQFNQWIWCCWTDMYIHGQYWEYCADERDVESWSKLNQRV